MKANFLKNNYPGVVNTIYLREIVPKGQKGKNFVFHPFIEAFNHVVTPRMQSISVGPAGAVSFRRTGMAEESYNITLVLPAVDATHARRNWRKVESLVKLTNPTAAEVLGKTAKFSLKIFPLIPRKITGIITKVDETIDLQAGYINGYPKVVRVTFEFKIDKLDEALKVSSKIIESDTTPASDDQAAAQTPGTADNLASKKKRKGNNENLSSGDSTRTRNKNKAARKV